MKTAALRRASLLDSVFAYVTRQGIAAKNEILAAFAPHAETHVASVLTDLVAAAVLYTAGTSDIAIYGVASEADRQLMICDGSPKEATAPVWGSIYCAPGITVRELVACSPCEAEDIIRTTVRKLVAAQHVRQTGEGDEARLTAARYPETQSVAEV